MGERADIVLPRNSHPLNMNLGGSVSTAHEDVMQADEALATLEIMRRDNLHLRAETSKRLLRRVDLIVMPVRANSIRCLTVKSRLILKSFYVSSMVFSSLTVRKYLSKNGFALLLSL